MIQTIELDEMQAASKQHRDRATEILNEVREENPEYHPNGFTLGHMVFADYVTSDTGEVVGVYGCNESKGTKYAMIAILKPFRNMGYGKKALAMLKEKVGDFKFAVHPDNAPSIKLAESFGCEVVFVQ